MKKACIECNQILEWNVYAYSLENFGAPLCYAHQDQIRNSKCSPYALKLYIELLKRGVPAQLEKWDGFKTIDIAIPQCKVNIEVDGMQHNYNHKQALSDLQRTYFSFLKGYLTLRIPNTLVERHLDEAAEYIVDFLNVNNERGWKESAGRRLH